jgi:hypothetical protein
MSSWNNKGLIIVLSGGDNQERNARLALFEEKRFPNCDRNSAIKFQQALETDKRILCPGERQFRTRLKQQG